MPAGSLLLLLDDLATVMDDVALLTKVAAKKTAGVLGDDLALNAQQVSGVQADRELPVVWAVAKGSLVNKAILVPVALGLSWFAPWAIQPLLMIGGAYLCYEGVEKLVHARNPPLPAPEVESPNPGEAERLKVIGAIRTDFILSAEIIVIALGTVVPYAFGTRVAVLVGVAVLMTAGVYGLVAGLVKLDDLGLHLFRKRGRGRVPRLLRRLGALVLRATPWLMRLLGWAGTAAMFLVGGGLLLHGWPLLAQWAEPRGYALRMATGLGLGFLAGALLLGLVDLGRRFHPGSKAPAAPSDR